MYMYCYKYNSKKYKRLIYETNTNVKKKQQWIENDDNLIQFNTEKIKYKLTQLTTSIVYRNF